MPSAIVVVEDDARVRTAFSRGLERAGFLVWAFSDGRAAWAFLESTPRQPDLVITDLAMPHVTGVELLARIAARYPQVLCVWASVLPRDDILASDPGLAQYASIQKPCAVPDLILAAETLLSPGEKRSNQFITSAPSPLQAARTRW